MSEDETKSGSQSGGIISFKRVNKKKLRQRKKSSDEESGGDDTEAQIL